MVPAANHPKRHHARRPDTANPTAISTQSVVPVMRMIRRMREWVAMRALYRRWCRSRYGNKQLMKPSMSPASMKPSPLVSPVQGSQGVAPLKRMSNLQRSRR